MPTNEPRTCRVCGKPLEIQVDPVIIDLNDSNFGMRRIEIDMCLVCRLGLIKGILDGSLENYISNMWS